jgi:hypoxanthine phosphoribosyltransferase
MLSSRSRAGYSAPRIAKQVAALGKAIHRDYRGRRLDVVITMDRGFIFAADLVRHLPGPVACHFVSADVRDVKQNNRPLREVFFGKRPDLRGRDVLLVDTVIESGVTQEFLLRRLGESRPRSLRLAVLLDKPARRHVSLEPDYFGFRTASNEVWVGYGLPAPNGLGRNLPALAAGGALTASRSRRQQKGTRRGKSRGRK